MSTGAVSSSRDRGGVQPLGYIPALDGLRAVAVLGVVAHHVATFFGGWIGVHLFFVLSGYLITRLLMVERARTGRVAFGVFYLRRFLRLYPALLVAAAVLLPLGFVAVPDAKHYAIGVGLASVYAINIVVTITGVGYLGWNHAWTLALEEQFYLVWPLALCLVPFRRQSSLAIVLVPLGLASLVGYGVTQQAGADALSFNPVWTGGGLLLGCGMALTQHLWAARAGGVGRAIAGVAMLAAGTLVGSTDGGSQAWAASVAALGSVLLIANVVTTQTWVSRLLAIRPAVWLGRISYEIYLWHFPLIALFPFWFPALPNPIAKAAAVPVAIIASAASHRWVSIPLNRRFKPRLAAREKVPSPLLDTYAAGILPPTHTPLVEVENSTNTSP